MNMEHFHLEYTFLNKEPNFVGKWKTKKIAISKPVLAPKDI